MRSKKPVRSVTRTPNVRQARSIADRKYAAALFAHGDDDLVDLQFVDEAFELHVPIQHQRRIDAGIGGGILGRIEADQFAAHARAVAQVVRAPTRPLPPSPR